MSLQGLERGLAVIQAFSDEAPAMTLSEVARRTDTSRASARRILLTLEELGFVRSDGRRFSLSPRVLSLGWSYLSALSLWEVARPFMEELSEEVQETCSACTLDLPDIVFVARVPARRRLLTMSLDVGSRLPAYATAMGRVLLAGLGDDAVAGYLAATPLAALTPFTRTDGDELAVIVAASRRDGFALVDQELELGLRSISVPMGSAALNLCAATTRVSPEAMVERFLPAMHRTSAEISKAWLQKT
jgi:IclR family pca regulon transcriptional regulator